MNIPVFLASDDRYAPFVAVTAVSILKNTNERINFYVLDCGISERKKKKILKSILSFNASVCFLPIDVSKTFPGFKETAHISLAMYARLLIPDLIPQIDKVIYTDVDVIFDGDIKQIFLENLDGYCIGACWEDFQEENGVNFERKKRLNIDPTHKYFCSGLLLIDCKRWRDMGATKRLFDAEMILRPVLDCPDQDVLNYVFQNSYKLLPASYSVVNQRVKDFYKKNKIVKKIVIRHFNGPKKPWHYPPETREKGGLLGMKRFWFYARQTSFYFELLLKFGYLYMGKKLVRKAINSVCK